MLLPLATWLNYNSGLSNSFYFLLAATLIYAIAVFGVTVFGNVPLNNILNQFDIEKASPAELLSLRQKFEVKWNTLHHIRTYAAILAFLSALLSLVGIPSR
ncbi:anthrone oxygenase family protein [Pedobacter sp. NJ-S-72]